MKRMRPIHRLRYDIIRKIKLKQQPVTFGNTHDIANLSLRCILNCTRIYGGEG